MWCPPYKYRGAILVWAVRLGPIAGIVSVSDVRAVAWANRNRPTRGGRVVVPLIVMGVLGSPQFRSRSFRGNGREISEQLLKAPLPPLLLLAVLVLKPLATVISVRGGAPSGLFAPSLALRALLGGLVGQRRSLL